MQNLLTVRDAAQLLKVRESTIRKWVKDGSLQAHKVGKSWRIVESDINKLIPTQSNHPSSALEQLLQATRVAAQHVQYRTTEDVDRLFPEIKAQLSKGDSATA